LAPFRALRPPVPSHATAEAPGGSDHKAFLPLGAAMLLASAGSFAQTPPATGVQLPTVTVKESAEIQNKDTLKPTTTTIGKGKQALRDIPQSVTVFTERLMNDRNQDDFRDVLRSTAGVTFQAGETGEEDIRLRGFSLGQAGDIYIDGMKDAPLYERDTFNNDSVEVLKGSASMLFGKGSTGGVVNQVNKMPLLMDQHEASYTLGTGQQHRLTGDFNFLTGENAAFRINALVHDEKNFGAKQRKLGIAPTYSWGVGTRDEFSVGLYALDIQGRPLYDHPWFLDGQRIVPSLPARNYYGLASDKLDSSAQYVTLAHTHRFDNNGELQTRLRHGRYERDLLASAVRFAAGTTRDNLNGDTVVTRSAKGRLGISELTQLQSDYTNTFAWGGRKHAVIAGVDLYYDDARRDQRYTGTGTMPNTTVGTPNDGAVRPTPRGAPTFNTFDASNLGLYVQDTVSVTDTVKLLGGLRWDRFEGTYHNIAVAANPNNPCTVTPATTIGRSDSLLSQRLGVLYQPSAYHSYHLSYGTSFNTSGDAYQYDAGNVEVDPEKSRNIELGGRIEAASGRLSTRFALFHSTKYNERNRDADTVDACNYVLSGKRHAAGIEVDVAGRVTPRWEMFVSYAFIPIAEVDESSGAPGTEPVGSRPGLTPRHTASLWTTYRLTPKWRLGGGLTARSHDKPVGLAATSQIEAPGYVTTDLMAEYMHGDFTFKVNLFNLADRHYADYLYRGHYVPGRPRTLQATVAYRF